MKLAYNYDQAAEQAGISRRTLQDAVRAGDIAVSYVGAKPVVLHDELDRWLHSLPHEPVRKSVGSAA